VVSTGLPASPKSSTDFEAALRRNNFAAILGLVNLAISRILTFFSLT
jgi:hypothetical protein